MQLYKALALLSLFLFSLDASAQWRNATTQPQGSLTLADYQPACDAYAANNFSPTTPYYAVCDGSFCACKYWNSSDSPCSVGDAWDQPAYSCTPDSDGNGIPDSQEPDPPSVEDCVIEGQSGPGFNIWRESEGCSNSGPDIPPVGSCSGGGVCAGNPGDFPGGDGESQPGWNCGTMNGQEVCIASDGVSGTGGGSDSPGVGSSEKTTGQGTAVETKDNGDGTSTTTETETTTKTKTETRPNSDGSSPGPGETASDNTGPSAPYVCSDGRLAADSISCDTAVTCPSDSYVAYGACIKLPTITKTEEEEEKSITITITDNSTGDVITTNTTNSTLTTAEDSEPEPCDPNTSYCGESFGEFDVYEETGDTFQQAFEDFKTNLQGTALVSSLGNVLVFDKTDSCPVWSASIGWFDLVFDYHCSGTIPWGVISAILIAISTLMAIRIALT